MTLRPTAPPARGRSARALDAEPAERGGDQLAVAGAADERDDALVGGPAQQRELLPVPEGEGQRRGARGGEGRIEDEGETESEEPEAHDEAQDRAQAPPHEGYFLSLASSSLAGAYSLLASSERSSIWMAFLSSFCRWLMSAR